MRGAVASIDVFLCAQKVGEGVFARAQPHVVFVVVAGRQAGARMQHWQRAARNRQTARRQGGMDG